MDLLTWPYLAVVAVDVEVLVHGYNADGLFGSLEKQHLSVLINGLSDLDIPGKCLLVRYVVLGIRIQVQLEQFQGTCT